MFFLVKNGISLLSLYEKPGMENVIRFCFIDTLDSESYYSSITTFIIFFTVVLLGLVQVGTGLYSASTHYRSMTFIRYGSKKRFLIRQVVAGVKNSLLIVSTMVFGFLLSFYHVVGNNSAKGEPGIEAVFLLILNFFLFFNLFGLINLYAVLKWNDVIAMVMIIGFGGGLFVLDDMIAGINIITYGKAQALGIGTGVLVISMVMMSVVLMYYSKYREML